MKITEVPFLQDFVRLTDDGFKKGWHERNGGNLSYRIPPDEIADVEKKLRKPQQWISAEVSVPNLAGEHFLVTGSGKYMRNTVCDPQANLAIVKIDEKGENYAILWGLADGERPTSEFPTHLMNHAITKRRTDGRHRVIYHAHPANAIALTFILPLEDKTFSMELWTMMTECPVVFPEGVGVVPWMVPGGREIALATAELIEKYNIVFWAHHGVFCSGKDFDEAFGMMDTVEKSAEVAVKVRSMGGKKQGMTAQNLRDMAVAFGVKLCEDLLELE